MSNDTKIVYKKEAVHVLNPNSIENGPLKYDSVPSFSFQFSYQVADLYTEWHH